MCDNKFSQPPSLLAKAVFRLTHGIKSYQPLYGVFCDDRAKSNIRFYACNDRRGLERIFVYAEEPYEEGGGCFLVNREDYDLVTAELKSLHSSA